MKKFLFVLMLAFISFSLVACAEIGVGGNAPEISAASWLNGNGIKLADCKDKYVVVEFWATWCPPCRKSIPHLKTMNAKYKDKNVIFVSLTDEDKATVRLRWIGLLELVANLLMITEFAVSLMLLSLKKEKLFGKAILWLV